MRRALLTVVLALLLAPAHADAHSLSKLDARAGATRFMSQVAWTFDHAQSGERVHVRPAYRCVRISHVTVSCPITVRLPSSGAVLRGFLRVHRTRQGLLGFLLPWDPDAVADTLGQTASSQGVADAVEIGVE